MKAVLVVFLCGILLSSAYTIGAPQSQPDYSLIPSAFAQTDISGNWTGTFEHFFKYPLFNYDCHIKGTVEANISQNSMGVITATFAAPPVTLVRGGQICLDTLWSNTMFPGTFTGNQFGSVIKLMNESNGDQLDGTISSNQLKFWVIDDTIQAGSYMLFTSHTSGGSASTDPDKDGLTGTADRCPNEFGPVENGGCPYKVADAEQYVNNGNYKKAAEITDEILKTEPRNMRAVWLGGISHFNLGNYNSSIGLFRTYTEIAPQDYTGFVELGRAYIALENYNEAINILGIGITLAPPDKQPPINTMLYYAQIDYFYQQGGNNVCHPAESVFLFTDSQTTTRTMSATDQIFYIVSPNHDFSRENQDVMDVKAINGNNPSEVVQIKFIETGDNTGIFFSDIFTYKEIFPVTPDTINFEFGNACTDLLKLTIFISGDPTVDSDGDGIFDNADSCINQKETFNNYQDRDGCPDTIPSDIDVIIQYNSSIPGCEESNSCYSPFSLNINAGDTVTWYNDDDAIKNVSSGTSDSGPDGLFDSGMLLSKEKFEFTFNDEGTFDYYNIIHPWMQGKIVIKYVPIDSDGDGILNENDLCPNDPENYNDFEDDDGCPDVSPAEQCITKHFTEATFDDPKSLIDASLKTITCVKFTQSFSNPNVSFPLMILYFWLASAYDDQGESEEKTSSAYGEVISYANKILNSDPNFSEAYYLIAYSYFKLEEYSNALSAIDKAIAIDPNDTDYQNLRDEILQYQKDVKSSSYYVTKINGEVTIIKDRIRNKNPTVNESILVENSIETLIGKINFSNEKAKFTLDEKTHILITASDYIHKIIDLKKGKLYASIEKSMCEGKDCKIITPISIQQITGGEFIINYDERTTRTTIYLKTGSMEIFPNEGQSQSFGGPKLIRIDKSQITESKEMSNNFWTGEKSFTEFERKLTEYEKDFDQWMYFENLIDCENEKDCDEEKAIIRFLIPKNWRFDVLIDLVDYDDYDDYDDPEFHDDFGGYGNFGNFAAYGALDDEYDNYDDYNGSDDYNGYDNHEDEDFGCEVDCIGLLVDKFKNSYRSGERFDDDTNLLWIGDWAFGEDEFIMVLLEKNNSFKSFGENQYLSYLEKLSEYFCQDYDPIYDEDCTIKSSEKIELLDSEKITAYHQKHFVEFEEDDGDHDGTINQVYRFTIIPDGNQIWTLFFASSTNNDWAYAPQFEITENSILFGEYHGPSPNGTGGTGGTDGTGGTGGTGGTTVTSKQKLTTIEITKKILSKSNSGTSFAAKYLDKAEPVTKKKVPAWVKNNAKWWSEKQIDDKAFFSGIQFLVKEKIISIPKDLVTKSKFIKFNAEDFTKPTTRGETVKVEISGKVDSFTRISIILEIQDPNNKTTEQTLVGTKGEYQTIFLLDNESPLGTYNVKVKFDGKIVDIGKFVLKSKFGDQNETVEDKGIPDWLRNNAKWWSQGLISEDDFIKGIEYLIQNGILTAPVDEEKIVEEKPEEKQTKTFSFQTKSLKLDKSTYKLPVTRGMTTIVSVTGEIDDYLTGVPVYLEIEMPDGATSKQKVRAAAGYYTTQIMIDLDFPTGEYILKVTYRGKIVDAIAFTVTK